MEIFQDEPTQPVDIDKFQDEPIALPRSITKRRLTPNAPRLPPGLELMSPDGSTRGYVSGQTWDDSGRIVFVIVEGIGHERTETPVEAWPESFIGWIDPGGRRV